MNRSIRRVLRQPRFFVLKRAMLLARGTLYLGRTFQCPCCGWRLRAFVTFQSVSEVSRDGYCPRCNAKARHRRDWLYLQEHTNLETDELRVLEVAPVWALARRLRSMKNIRYQGLDLRRTGPHVSVVGDVTEIPLPAESVDALLCIHVLEHVERDRQAIAELHRVLAPGGWALVSVPVRPDHPTHEDPSVIDPAERARLFGERGHVRAYGLDLAERLEAAGFEVTVEPADELTDAACSRFGLRRDETVFFCRKRPSAGG
jgi:hypothetical protein